jgi:hypothetical protein
VRWCWSAAGRSHFFDSTAIQHTTRVSTESIRFAVRRCSLPHQKSPFGLEEELSPAVERFGAPAAASFIVAFAVFGGAVFGMTTRVPSARARKGTSGMAAPPPFLTLLALR